MTRSYFACFFVLITLFCQAQNTQRVHLFDCDSAIRPHEKILLAEFNVLDEASKLSIDGTLLKIRISDAVPPARLLSVLNQLGIGEFHMHAGQRSENSASIVDPNASFPVRSNSGDPLADDAEYERAKQRWIQEHPEAYRQRSSGSAVETNTDPIIPE